MAAAKRRRAHERTRGNGCESLGRKVDRMGLYGGVPVCGFERCGAGEFALVLASVLGFRCQRSLVRHEKAFDRVEIGGYSSIPLDTETENESA